MTEPKHYDVDENGEVRDCFISTFLPTARELIEAAKAGDAFLRSRETHELTATEWTIYNDRLRVAQHRLRDRAEAAFEAVVTLTEALRDMYPGSDYTPNCSCGDCCRINLLVRRAIAALNGGKGEE